ncbi:MAG TPA: hypothetical protein VLF91_06740 [Candidatus Saccharimonadales bacterium]|nr:hypothetical protein [Candidatus Saccharimonadales bacterium]
MKISDHWVQLLGSWIDRGGFAPKPRSDSDLDRGVAEGVLALARSAYRLAKDNPLLLMPAGEHATSAQRLGEGAQVLALANPDWGSHPDFDTSGELRLRGMTLQVSDVNPATNGVSLVLPFPQRDVYRDGDFGLLQLTVRGEHSLHRVVPGFPVQHTYLEFMGRSTEETRGEVRDVHDLNPKRLGYGLVEKLLTELPSLAAYFTECAKRD